MALRRRPPDCIPQSVIDAATTTREQRIEGELAAAASAERVSTGGGRKAPPLVTRGERVGELVLDDGRVKEILSRRGFGGSRAFIDWINFTVDESSFNWTGALNPVTDDQVVVEVSRQCEKIFGFGITTKREKGANFYEHSYDLGEGLGLVCYGGQRDTVLVMVSGEGCSVALEGWEKRLHDFLVGAVRARITRVDLAHDDFDGSEYSVEKADIDYDAELFRCGGRMPDVEHRGNWRRPNGKGRTLYVGNRKNGKFARVYEKGRQLGGVKSSLPAWVRIEVEFKAVDRIIPFDVLLDAGAYLAASYPAFAFLAGVQKRIETVRNTAAMTYQKMLDWLEKQCGAALWAAKEIEGSAEALLAKIMRVGVFPKSLVGGKSCSSGGVPVHKMVRPEYAPGMYCQLA